MELAGRGAAEAIHARWPDAPVAVLCGPGNNGGDGYVVARWLSLWGHRVKLWATGVARTEDARRNAGLCAAMGLAPVRGLKEALDGAVVGVDALLGTGQDRPPSGAFGEAVRRLGAGPDVVVALDLPTGLCGDTGQALGRDVVNAHLTITFGFAKPGCYAMPGAALRGELQVIDIGVALGRTGDLAQADALVVEATDVVTPPPAPGAAKWDRGHVAVRARGGAAVLAAHGAFRGGAGLVTLLLPRDEWAGLHGLWPEVILAEPEALDPRRHDVLVIGPALGHHEVDAVCGAWRDFPGAVVADADALTVLARGAPPPVSGARLITPHSAEAARLLGCTREEVDADRFGTVDRLTTWGTAVLKGPYTLVASGADPVRINPTGGPALATAGTGDVLAGLIGGGLARGLEPLEAATGAVYHHGCAGDTLGPRATASDLVEALR